MKNVIYYFNFNFSQEKSGKFAPESNAYNCKKAFEQDIFSLIVSCIPQLTPLSQSAKFCEV